jgi:hypothetical protein
MQYFEIKSIFLKFTSTFQKLWNHYPQGYETIMPGTLQGVSCFFSGSVDGEFSTIIVLLAQATLS